MFVCHCRGVTDGTVRDAIEAGAASMEALVERCDAGSGCGGCCGALRRLLAEYGLAGAA